MEKSTTNPLRFRDEIVINNEITVELDFSSFHPKMIYDLEGLEMEGDPYVGIGDLDRDHGKSIFNMMINSLDENKAIGAYMKEYRDEGITKAKAREAVNSVLERHHSIHRKFFSGLGLKLMNYDSQIANDVMLRAINEFRTVVLPVHDSFICITEFKDQLRELMSDSYTEVMKPEVPVVIDRKYSDYYISDEEELYQDEYGIQYEYEIPPDPGQIQRTKALEKQASAARLKYGIWFENAFTPEHLSDKYAPQEPDR